MMGHFELMGAEHSGVMFLSWFALLVAVFAMGYFAGRASGRRKQQDSGKPE